MHVVAIRARDQQSLIPVHLRLQEISVLLMRLVGVDVIRPDVVLATGPAHRRSLLNRIGVLRDQLVAADPGPRKFSGFAERLRISDSRPSVTLPPIVTAATERAGPFGRKILRVDDRTRPAFARNVLRARTVTTFATDIDLVR